MKKIYSILAALSLLALVPACEPTPVPGGDDKQEENKGDNKVEEKDKDDNIDNEPMNFFDDSDDDIFKSIIDTSYEYLDDDFIKNIQKRFV